MSGFNQRKVAQIAAFFADAEGGSINVLKLVKLIYLSDRKFLDEFGKPITYDSYYSLPHGPIVSTTYDLMSGGVRNSDDWDEWISDQENYELSVRLQVNREALDELSDAEYGVMAGVWSKFGSFGKWKLSEWTHDNCGEWKNPHGSSVSFDYKDILVALGRDAKQAEEIDEDLESEKRLRGVLARI